jgi:FtsH-binding integral membrane protein
MTDILAWIVIVFGTAGAAGHVVGLYPHRSGREVPDSSERRAAWYWIGLSFVGIFSGLSILANDESNGFFALATAAAAGAIVCASATAWTVHHIRGH